MTNEIPIVFNCNGERLVGILHSVECDTETGVVIVVGGPQYRVGSHRQFVHMARQISAAGYPVLRFDYRGMGDSQGRLRTFEEVDDDILAAVNCITAEVSSLRKIVLLGLCDAASASLMYCKRDARVKGLVLLNPWVRTVAGEAKSFLKYYYLQRLFQKSFWRKVTRGDFELAKSAGELFSSIRDARGNDGTNEGRTPMRKEGFISRMRAGLHETPANVLILTSGRDLTAREFLDLCSSNSQWKSASSRRNVAKETLPLADHTMSRRSDMQSACRIVVNWIKGWQQ